MTTTAIHWTIRFDVTDISETTLADIVATCADFQAANTELLSQAGDEAQNGHDFFLTRNRHGAGFWDRGYGAVGRQLTDAAHAYGSHDFYVGDDGLLYAN